MSMTSRAAPYRRDDRQTMRVPVVMPLVEVDIDHKGYLAVALDREPYSADGSLTRESMQGGTFTVTNLGAFGIDAFTPIINWPECAILGIGRIQKTPVVRDGQIVARDVVTLSLTFDHRIADGAPAARFLAAVVKGVENPAASLLG